MLENTEEQSRMNNTERHWKHWAQKTQGEDKQNTENWKDEQRKTLPKPEVNTGAREGKAVIKP